MSFERDYEGTILFADALEALHRQKLRRPNQTLSEYVGVWVSASISDSEIEDAGWASEDEIQDLIEKAAIKSADLYRARDELARGNLGEALIYLARCPALKLTGLDDLYFNSTSGRIAAE